MEDSETKTEITSARTSSVFVAALITDSLSALITEIKGIMSYVKIVRRFGEQAAFEYFSGFPYMQPDINIETGKDAVLIHIESGKDIKLSVGDVMDEYVLYQVADYMKACKDRLSEIKRRQHRSNVKSQVSIFI